MYGAKIVKEKLVFPYLGPTFSKFQHPHLFTNHIIITSSCLLLKINLYLINNFFCFVIETIVTNLAKF